MSTTILTMPTTALPTGTPSFALGNTGFASHLGCGNWSAIAAPVAVEAAVGARDAKQAAPPRDPLQAG